MCRLSGSLIALFIFALGGLAVSPAAAHYSENCWVKPRIEYPSTYRRSGEYGYYSDIQLPVFAVTCNYVTGAELNQRAGAKRFAENRIYVVILWPNSPASYIRISQSLSLCGPVAEAGCAERIAGRLSGYDTLYDRYGRVFRRSWDICQPGFIDRNCYRALGGYRD
jgi:hypothetical protein